MTSLAFEPMIPPAVWLLLAAGGVGMLAWYGASRPRRVERRRWVVILTLAALGYAAALLVLLNPTWVEPVPPPPGKPTVTIVVDATGSMATPDSPSGRSRFQSAVEAARTCADRLGDRFDVRVRTLADGLRPTDLAALDAAEPDGRETDLAAAVRSGFEGDRPGGQAMILLSDGIHTVGATARVLEACRAAKAMSCQVSTRTFGGDAEVKDLAVELRAPQEVGFVGRKVAVSVLVRNRGYVGSPATVVLSADGKELDRKAVALTAVGSAEARFEIAQDKPGTYRYSASVEPAADEVNRANNAALLVFRVVDRPVRVLVLEGKPYWDNKFLARTLIADPFVELDTVVRVGDNRVIRRTISRPPADPASAAPSDQWAVLPDAAAVFNNDGGLRGYQLVVLGRDAEAFLTDAVLAQLQDWVARDGGCLVCYRGPPTGQANLRLGRLLPVRWTPAPEARFRPRLTDRGRALRIVPPLADPQADPLAELPELATDSRADQPKPLAVVLATAGPRDGRGEPEPVVCYQPYGGGRVVVIEGAGMWRWAFLPPHKQQLDDVYRGVWYGLLRWLVSTADLLPGQALAVRAEKSRFQPGEAAAVNVFVRDGGPAAPPVELAAAGGATVRTVTPVPMPDDPGTFRAAFGPLPEGQYEARVQGTAAATAFEVRDPSAEKLDLRARPDLMARIAEETDGVSLDGRDLNDLAEVVLAHWDETRPRQVRRVTAWDRAGVFGGILVVWAAAWTLRRRGGLV
jgi:hypothetical protein